MVFSSVLEQGPASSIPQAVAKEIETWAAEMGASNLQEKWEGFSPCGKPCKNTCFFNISKGYPDVFVVFCLIEKVYIFNDMSTFVLDSRWFVFSEVPISC